MGNILYCLAHDPVGNCEWQVSDFDRSALAKNAENNIVFIAVDESGNREIVDASEVVEPPAMGEPLVLVQPVYVDERMMATVAVFDALAADLYPSAAVMTMSAEAADSAAEGGFMAAVARLKGLVYGKQD